MRGGHWVDGSLMWECVSVKVRFVIYSLRWTSSTLGEQGGSLFFVSLFIFHPIIWLETGICKPVIGL